MTDQATPVPSVETKLVEMLDALQSGAVTIGEQVVKYSPDVADAALWVVRIDGAQSILGGVVLLVLAIIGYKYGVRLWRWAGAKVAEHDEMVYVFPLALFALTSLASIRSLFILSNVWNWIAIFQPKLYLAKQIIGAAVGK